jgi:hypothetical protein
MTKPYLSRQGLSRLAFLAAGVSLILSLLSSGASADVEGEIVGHAHTVEALLLGSPVLGVNSIDLPPDSSLGVNLSADAVGVLVLNSSTAATDCSGIDAGPEVVAKCVSTVEDLEVGVTGLGALADFVLIEATTLRAVSKSSDDGTTAQSLNNDPDTGEVTEIVGLCIATDLAQVLGGTCTAINAAGTVNISIDVLGVPLLAGTVTVWDEDTRTTDGALTGTGLTVTMLLVQLTVLGTDTVELSLVQADSFVGNVVQVPPTETPTTAPTDTPVPPTDTPAPTNTPDPAATNTPVPTATDTPVPTNTAAPAAPTNTPVPTNTPDPAATNTPVPTATSTATPTGTAAPTSTPVIPSTGSTSLPPAAPVNAPASVPGSAPMPPASGISTTVSPPNAGDGGLVGMPDSGIGLALLLLSGVLTLGGFAGVTYRGWKA